MSAPNPAWAAGLAFAGGPLYPPSVVFYLFLLGLAAFGGLIYLAVFVSQVPGATEERLGEWEALPEGLGKWTRDADSAAARSAAAKGLEREVRWLHDPDAGIAGGGKLVRQVRYRNVATQEIARVDPDEIVKRRRSKKGASSVDNP